MGCKYLTSISQASIYRPELSVWVTPQTDYCCLLLDAIVGTKIEQHRSGIGCHNNFVKAKDAFSRVRERFWNMRLMMFYLNVSYVPTLRDVGHYKLWNEVMFWFTQIMCYNVYIPLLIRPGTLYVQKCRLMRIKLGRNKIKHKTLSTHCGPIFI